MAGLFGDAYSGRGRAPVGIDLPKTAGIRALVARALLTVAVAVAALPAIALSAPAAAATTPPPPRTATVRVQPGGTNRNGYTDTGLDVHPGDQVMVTASGSIDFGWTGITAGPEGYSCQPDGVHYFLACANGPYPYQGPCPDISGDGTFSNCLALVGEVGNNGWLTVGSARTWVACGGGRLILGGASSNYGNHDPNTGYWTAKISVSPAPPWGTLIGDDVPVATFGTTFTGKVAHSTDIRCPDSSMSAIVDWGDGSTSLGSLSAGAAGLTVTGTHTWWTPGELKIKVTLTLPITPPRVWSATSKADVASRYVALGDSFASGEGANVGASNVGSGASVYGQQISSAPLPDGTWPRVATDDSSSDICHRSAGSYPRRLYTALTGEVAHLSFTDVACSGAVMADITSPFDQNNHGGFYPHDPVIDGSHLPAGDDPPSYHNGEGAQIDALANDVSLVTVSIGGNDLGFSTVVTTCGASGSDSRHNDVNCRGLDEDLTLTEGKVQAQLVSLYGAIKAKAPGARIMVTGYPRFFPAGGSSTCPTSTSLSSQFVPLDGVATDYINTRIQLADDMIAAAAARSGVADYVDVYDAFKGHELCNGNPDNWDMNGVIAFLTKPRPSYESFHPRPVGHGIEAGLVLDRFHAYHPLGTVWSASGANASERTQVAVASGGGASVSINLPAPSSRRPYVDGVSVEVTWATDSTPHFNLKPPGGANGLSNETSTSPGHAAIFELTGSEWSPGPWTLDIVNGSPATTFSVVVLPWGNRFAPLADYTVVQDCNAPATGTTIALNGTGASASTSPSDKTNSVVGWAWTDDHGDNIGTSAVAVYTQFEFHNSGPSIMLTVTDAEGVRGYWTRKWCS